MKFISKDKTIDFENFKYYTSFFQNTPRQQERRYRVIGKDEDVIFTNGLENKQVQLVLMPIETSIQKRVLLYRELKAEFLKGGEIILDAENDVKYKCKLLQGTNIVYSGNYDTITVRFDLSPTATSSIDPSNLTWNDADISFILADLQWNGNDLNIPVGSGTFTLRNKGNYVARPLLKIKGNVTITCNGKTLQTINSVQTVYEEYNGGTFLYFGTVNYVDCKNFIVYDETKQNKMDYYFLGDFIELIPGDNIITVTVSNGSSLLNITDYSRWV